MSPERVSEEGEPEVNDQLVGVFKIARRSSFSFVDSE